MVVSELIQEGRWLWPEEWSNDFKELRQVQISNLNDRNEDTAVWDQIIDKMKVLPAKRNISSIVRRLVCGAAVYYIWQERNNRLLKNEKRESKKVLNIAKEAVGMKLIRLKVKESMTIREIEERWNVKMQRR
ncbi:hypothetical protein Tco_1327944 [Tanacetum coccineum]